MSNNSFSVPQTNTSGITVTVGHLLSTSEVHPLTQAPADYSWVTNGQTLGFGAIFMVVFALMAWSSKQNEWGNPYEK